MGVPIFKMVISQIGTENSLRKNVALRMYLFSRKKRLQSNKPKRWGFCENLAVKAVLSRGVCNSYVVGPRGIRQKRRESNGIWRRKTPISSKKGISGREKHTGFCFEAFG